MTPPPAEKVAEPFTPPFKVHQWFGSDSYIFVVQDSTGKDASPALEDESEAQWLCTRLSAAAPAPSVAQSEREAFEAWEIETFGYETLDRITDASEAYYCDSRVQHDWGIWKGARASAGSARVGARAALCELEAANDATCSLRSDAAYQELVRCPGMSDALLRLDRARAEARAIIAAHTHSAPPALTEEERSLVETATDMLDAEPTHPLGLTGLEKRMLAIITRLTS